MSDAQQDKPGDVSPNTQAPKLEPSMSNPTSVEAEAKKKQKIQNAIKSFIQQIKVGCNKQICFSQYCRKNIFGTSHIDSTHDYVRDGASVWDGGISCHLSLTYTAYADVTTFDHATSRWRNLSVIFLRGSHSIASAFLPWFLNNT